MSTDPMSSGPISSVPGFVRKEQPVVDPLPSTTAVPLISAVPPGIKAPQASPVESPPVAPPIAPPVEPPPVAPPVATPPAPPVAPPSPPVQALDDADFFVDLDAELNAADDDDLDATRLAAPRPISLVLRWDDGAVTVITRPTVIGRGPVGGEGDEVEAIADPTLSLSKSHARFVAAPEASVTDLHSTNGMLIERAGAQIAVPPGVPIPLTQGDVVVVGKRRLVVEVTR